MRRTPPVVVQLQPQRAVQAVAALIAALRPGGLAGRAASHQAMAWTALLAVPLAVLQGWRAAAAQPRRLRWGGEACWLGEADLTDQTPPRSDVLVDLDAWLLLSSTRFVAACGSLRR